MSPLEAAEYLGVSPRTILRTMKREGMRWTVAKHKGVYNLTEGEVDYIARVLIRNNRLQPGTTAYIKRLVRQRELSARP